MISLGRATAIAVEAATATVNRTRESMFDDDRRVKRAMQTDGGKPRGCRVSISWKDAGRRMAATVGKYVKGARQFAQRGELSNDVCFDKGCLFVSL
jgi:hypothetical protein